MLKPGDYDLPLEKELRLSVIKKEIKECNNIDALRENLLTCAESLMKYQHVCAKLAEENLRGFMNDFFEAMGVETIKEGDS